MMINSYLRPLVGKNIKAIISVINAFEAETTVTYSHQSTNTQGS